MPSCITLTRGQKHDVYGRLAGAVIYANAYRSSSSILVRNRHGQSGLWGYGISGDLPIVLVRIRDREKLTWFVRLSRHTRTGG